MRWPPLPLDLRHQGFRPEQGAILLATLHFIASWDGLATQTCGERGEETGAFVRSDPLAYGLPEALLWGRPPPQRGKRLIGKETCALRSNDGHPLQGPFHQGPMLGLTAL